ncbi:MAG: SAM-dependent chlorinase/fluorinase [Acidobacteria bacterium]|nr:SAM-dependent chlorinase/fluorinase [Acidobacteriota bacterium]
MERVITLTTDFGLADGYVGTMKGVILGINPRATIVDLSHEIPPQDVFEAAFVLGASYPYFPSNSIHVVVVDPGVGSQRAALAVETPRGIFVGPDNGVLSWPIRDGIAAASALIGPHRGGLSSSSAIAGEAVVRGRPDDDDQAAAQTPTASRWPAPRSIAIPPTSPVKAVKLTQAQFWPRSVSQTFHGRDVFAPVAAYLSLGTTLQSLGHELAEVCILPLRAPLLSAQGRVDGEIIKVDRFGNLITNIRAPDIRPLGQGVVFHVAGEVIQGLSQTYQEKPGLVALIGSSGYVEIALSNGSAARNLGLGRGDKVVALKAPRRPNTRRIT